MNGFFSGIVRFKNPRQAPSSILKSDAYFLRLKL
jgi:hypothetical protein